MAASFRKLRPSPAVSLGESNTLSRAPFTRGKKIIQKPHTGINLTIQGPLTDFLHRTSVGETGGGNPMQKREERSSLNLILNMSKNTVQVSVCWGREGSRGNASTFP